VGDIERSARFYSEALAGRPLTRTLLNEGPAVSAAFGGPPGMRAKYMYMGFEDGAFELIEFLEPRVPTGAVDAWEERIMHYCFTVPDVPAALARIEAAGGQTIIDTTTSVGSGPQWAIAADPDGNMLQLIDVGMDEVVARMVAGGNGPV
jgi:catechol 2,3-dioxygenase-like lactoylglutathione lyase family enzyme